MIHVLIPGQPVPQGRGRIITLAGHGAIKDPERSRSWKGYAQEHMMRECPKPLEGPLAVSVTAYFPCPTSDHRKRNPRPERWHTKANGDADNLGKAVLDAGNGILYEDDRQVSILVVKKLICAQGRTPQVQVWVRPLPVGKDGEAPLRVSASDVWFSWDPA
jgi:Holliday junction resolvase RusA-like endonuclease